MAVPAGSAMPTEAEVKNGLDYAGVVISAAGNTSVEKDIAQPIDIINFLCSFQPIG